MPVGPRPAWPVGVARVAIRGTFFGHQWVAVHYVSLAHTNPVTVNDLKTVADWIGAHYITIGTGYVSSSVILTQVDVSFIPSLGNVLDYTGSYSVAGIGGTAVGDASACQRIDWIISDRYRGGHPGTYVPGPVLANVTNGSDISSAAQSGLVSAAETYRNGLNALTSTNITAIVMGTVRYESSGSWLSPPVFRAYTSSKFGKGGKLASQRRRIVA